MSERRWLVLMQISLFAFALLNAIQASEKPKPNPFASPEHFERVVKKEGGLQQTGHRVVGISIANATANDAAVAVLRLNKSTYRIVEVGDEFDDMEVVSIDEKRVALKTESGIRYLFLLH